MAFAIINAAIGAAIAGDTWDGLPANRILLADQTVTTATQNFATVVRAVRAFIWLKAFTRGTGTVGPVFEIQVADNAGFTVNVRTIAASTFPNAATASLCAEYINGVVPDNLLAAWCRIKVTFSGTDSGTFDVSLDAT